MSEKKVPLNNENSVMHANPFLLYSLQEASGKSSVEVTNYFYELFTELSKRMHEALIGQSSSKRSFTAFYPGTQVPFCITVELFKTNRYSRNANEAWIGMPTVDFPTSKRRFTSINVSNLIRNAEAIMEHHMLDGSMPTMAPFEKPAMSASPIFGQGITKAFVDQDVAKGRFKDKKKKKK